MQQMSSPDLFSFQVAGKNLHTMKIANLMDWLGLIILLNRSVHHHHTSPLCYSIHTIQFG